MNVAVGAETLPVQRTHATTYSSDNQSLSYMSVFGAMSRRRRRQLLLDAPLVSRSSSSPPRDGSHRTTVPSNDVVTSCASGAKHQGQGVCVSNTSHGAAGLQPTLMEGT